MLKSRETLPPGGWVFRQPETNWVSKFGRTFEETVDDIIKHRSVNPRFKLSTEWSAVATELELFTELRLRSMRGAESYLTPTDPKPMRLQHPPIVSVTDVAGAKKPSVVAGVPILINWLGSGLHPVSKELAAERAAICADCQQNQKGDWRHYFTEPVAALLKTQMAIKNDMALTTPSDENLNVCKACLCELKLKVWTPLPHITDHLDDDMKRRLDERCWILKVK
jgi:hypothetical protein